MAAPARRLLGLRFEGQPVAALLSGVVAAAAYGAAAGGGGANDTNRPQLKHFSMEKAQLLCAAAAVAALTRAAALSGLVSLGLPKLEWVFEAGDASEADAAAQLLRDVTRLLAHPACRLRSLVLDGGNDQLLGEEAAAAGGALGDFAAALQANASLRVLSLLRRAVAHPAAAALVWGALARREAPLEALRASQCCFSDGGACDTPVTVLSTTRGLAAFDSSPVLARASSLPPLFAPGL